MSRLREIKTIGQSIWLDYIQRGLLVRGELKDLMEKDGISGVTSNPTIFEKAISGTEDYNPSILSYVQAEPGMDAMALFERLAVEDIRMAADLLRPIYDETDGLDGYVSMEVSPHLAHDTAGTLSEVKRLWKEINRPNLMIKVPATPEGIPAIEALTAEGININVTLIFSMKHYESVARAYIRGLTRCSDPVRVSSVASFFVSRLDTAVDRLLDRVGTPEALSLKGKTAIANARIAYRRFCEIFYGEPFFVLRNRGARVQRVLWGSTGTKNPAYSDVYYVEELIGPDTVNTIPPATLEAFRNHGRVCPALDRGGAEAEKVLQKIEAVGVDLGEVTEQLQKDGVKAFADSFDNLLHSLAEKLGEILARESDGSTIS